MNKMKELIVQFIEAESKANKNDQDYVNCDCCLQRFSRQDVSYLDENSDLSEYFEDVESDEIMAVGMVCGDCAQKALAQAMHNLELSE